MCSLMHIQIGMHKQYIHAHADKLDGLCARQLQHTNYICVYKNDYGYIYIFCLWLYLLKRHSHDVSTAVKRK